MKASQSIRQTAVAVLLVGFSSTLIPVAHAGGCPEEMQPQTRRLRLIMIDGAARKGPPEIAQAAVALRAGRLQDAIALLDKAASIPIAESARHGRDFVYAVNDAQESAWALSGCP